jgi:hypothetical protein
VIRNDKNTEKMERDEANLVKAVQTGVTIESTTMLGHAAV